MLRQEFTVGDRRVVMEVDERAVVIYYALSDADGSGKKREVVVHLTENVEAIIQRVADKDHGIIGDNELAVARVELFEGQVRAMLWDETTCNAPGDEGMAQIVPLVASCR